jgi:aminopeptidase YwaD
MEPLSLPEKSLQYLQMLCLEIPERSVGSEGNRSATWFFAETATALGWQVESQEFDAMDWQDGGASLQVGGESYQVFASPYSLSCDASVPLVGADTLAALERADLRGKLVLLHGEIAREQLMPKNFVFYNPEEHQRTIAALEQGKPAAILCATGRNASLAGGVYPFPLIEDGDFDIPSVYMTEEEGQRLLPQLGKPAHVVSNSKRIPGKGYNVIARKGDPAGRRIVVSAHIDAKKGTPGAIDNASGVVVLLLLADLLQDYKGTRQVELAAFNGEDYYAVPGQMLFFQKNMGHFDDIALNINIDGAGYLEGPSAFSFYGLPEQMEKQVKDILATFEGITEGAQWVQGDHSIFIQAGRPAVAVTSDWFSEHVDSQEITHTPKDNLTIVDPGKLVEIARALEAVIRRL